ncbi:hypothetical protein M422DRAFT_126185, partial [Sphaerobolus stellatus SS14]
RMPTPIGEFISQHIYEGRLQSEHPIEANTCLAFVQADGEEAKAGTSRIVSDHFSLRSLYIYLPFLKNMKEVQTVIHLVRHYYRDSEFVVITPYIAQRGLPWKGRVFNVDSFQANIVSISTVKTASSGFLKNSSRVNVMLTRCKMGMIIVSNSSF